MYKKILVALENSPADDSLVPHVAELARTHHSHLHLVHVADGWAARHYNQLKLTESEEMREDRQYLEKVATELREDGLAVTTALAMGDPSTELLKEARHAQCDLIAMTTHGHRLLGDLIFGSTITHVRHRAAIPVLLVRAQRLK